MRLVKLPPNSPRGGVLTQGTVLTITSNPDRTSPVKRGLFILDNVLGTPPPPPPPDIPTLEEATTKSGEKPQTLREALKIHREDALCASCHNRMDPLGLAFENFNALGRWRDKERKEPIDAAGQLVTGETFTSVQELKHILVANHRRDFFRCLTEKLLTYALGRGLDYYDVEAVDRIVDRLDQTNGRPSALVTGIIESVPFQKRRSPGAADAPVTEQGGHRPRANGTFLTGVRLNKSATNVRAGVSIDQVLARQVGHLTRFPSLELSCDPERKSAGCDSGYSCAYQYNLSWSSQKTPVPAEANPRHVFERMFGSGAHGERQTNLRHRQ